MKYSYRVKLNGIVYQAGEEIPLPDSHVEPAISPVDKPVMHKVEIKPAAQTDDKPIGQKVEMKPITQAEDKPISVPKRKPKSKKKSKK